MIWKYGNRVFTLYHKVLFMEEKNQSADSLQDLKDIRRIMERSSRFISLSGLSGVAAGICALVGVFFANQFLNNYYGSYNSKGFFSGDDFSKLKIRFTLLAAVVFAVAFISSFYLTWRKAKKQGLPIWDHTTKRLAWNMMVPLITGGFFILGMLRYDAWLFVAPACLIFYGLALVNASKYTLNDIRYLGYCEIVLGLINMFIPGYGLWIWAIGFGVLHIVYGIVMWRKYERS
jgi:hypothetical protein